ncbi:MAG: winged helix-turn-helix transcriptional regulator [Alphaproteobacteria bacterium]|nr:winged helix-turn-helix transcriptional regulator [Alphaproteobacteria bacterium]
MAYEGMFSALGDPTRRTVFERLRQGPQTVGALAACLPVSRPAISQHLKVLETAGLVAHQADGTRHLYRLEGRGLTALRDYLQALCEEVEAAHAAEIARQLEERRYG